MKLLKTIALALSFLTLLPCGGGKVSGRTITASGAYFPLAGWLIGVLMACLGLGLIGFGMTSQIAAILLVAFEAWITRGLHLDGVADLCDGFGGSFESEKRLAIMKDSATGAFGVVGLVITLILKISTLASLLAIARICSAVSPLFVFCCIAFVPALARWAMLTLAWKSSYPREYGTGHAFVGNISWRELSLGFIMLLPVLAMGNLHVAGYGIFAAIFFATLLPSLVLRYYAHKLLGGVTGDVLGASCELAEALGWLAASLCLSS
ncbi:MAG: adenosylcobinamide-GDP ribazoletransferase [Desulfobulbaceae bacterium]|nr:adenosylcobinamide-GDP ribazoletransferase [Desulfobulbaceae bacterium]